MNMLNTAKKRLQIARLNAKIKELVSTGKALCDPAVVRLSRKMDRLVVEILRAEGAV